MTYNHSLIIRRDSENCWIAKVDDPRSRTARVHDPSSPTDRVASPFISLRLPGPIGSFRSSRWQQRLSLDASRPTHSLLRRLFSILT